MPCLRKQVSFFLPLPQWVLVRNEAIRQGIPITELCRRWMSEEMQRLNEQGAGSEEQRGPCRSVNGVPQATISPHEGQL